MTYIVTITGSRARTDEAKVRQDLVTLKGYHSDLLLRFGDCPTGVDAMAKRWAKDFAVPYMEFLADRNPNGSFKGHWAGPVRNRKMVNTQPWADLCVAFPDEASKGTIGCAKLARASGLPLAWLPQGAVPCLECQMSGDHKMDCGVGRLTHMLFPDL